MFRNKKKIILKFKCAGFEIDSFFNELKEKKSNEKLSPWQFVMMQMHKKQFNYPLKQIGMKHSV